MGCAFRSIFVLTGAGISAESGLRTFRDSNGLWEGYRVEEVATPEGFRADPALVHEFYNQRRRQLAQATPNAAHYALASFQKVFKGEFFLVTQNVDDLHERAGSEGVLHMHGELLKARCVDTGEVFEWRQDLTVETEHPRFPARRGRLRPHIVWFGERPLHMDVIGEKLSHCDLFIAIGTSGSVYPAAGFVAQVPRGCHKVELNLKATEIGHLFDECRFGKASECVPALFQGLLR